LAGIGEDPDGTSGREAIMRTVDDLTGLAMRYGTY
jgi:hypothetical protein